MTKLKEPESEPEPEVEVEWWSRPDLHYRDNRLVLNGRCLQSIASQFGTPTFVYHGQRVLDNASRIHQAIQRVGLADRFRLHYAMKANRFAPLLTFLKSSGLVSIDACSPNEVEHAIGCGFDPAEVSFTAGSLSETDIRRISSFPSMHINCDSMTAIRRLGEIVPGRSIGIRVNPAAGLGRADNAKLQYAGSDTSKFGIYREQFPDALKLAEKFGLSVETIHFHTGCGYLNNQLDKWDSVIEQAWWFVDQVPGLKSVNVGGGLGVPHIASDCALDLDRWANILAKHFLNTDLKVEVEPGDYLVKDCGVLLLQVTGVEQKREINFVGLNAGFNVAVEPVVYGLPFEPVPVVKREGERQNVTLHGNINEALDIWYRNFELPPVWENDIMALINAGAYSSSMASNHCMRGEFKEVLLVN